MRSTGDELDGLKADDNLKHALITDWRSVALSEINRSILDYAEKITRDPAGITQEYVDTLKGMGLTEAMIHDTVQAAAYFNYINRLADALGVELEEE